MKVNPVNIDDMSVAIVEVKKNGIGPVYLD